MHIYILFHDYSPEFRMGYILGVYSHPSKANKELRRLKLLDAATYEGLRIMRRKVK